MKTDSKSKVTPRKEKYSSTPVQLCKGEPKQSDKDLNVASAHTEAFQQMPQIILLKLVLAHKRFHYWSFLLIGGYKVRVFDVSPRKTG